MALDLLIEFPPARFRMGGPFDQKDHSTLSTRTLLS